MQSVCLTTGADSWVDVSEVSSERLWQGIEESATASPSQLCGADNRLTAQVQAISNTNVWGYVWLLGEWFVNSVSNASSSR